MITIICDNCSINCPAETYSGYFAITDTKGDVIYEEMWEFCSEECATKFYERMLKNDIKK